MRSQGTHLQHAAALAAQVRRVIAPHHDDQHAPAAHDMDRLVPS